MGVEPRSFDTTAEVDTVIPTTSPQPIPETPANTQFFQPNLGEETTHQLGPSDLPPSDFAAFIQRFLLKSSCSSESKIVSAPVFSSFCKSRAIWW